MLSCPSICFSEMKTVENEYCQIYLGNKNNKKELDVFRKTVKEMSLYGGLYKIVTTKYGVIRKRCLDDIIIKYIDKLTIVTHSEKNNNICDKVRMTYNKEILDTYLWSNYCFDNGLSWEDDINELFYNNTDKINMGIIIETKLSELDKQKKEDLEIGQEKSFFNMIQRNKDKYTFVDRKHLKTLLEEQKLSASGLTDSETVKLGKLLNLDVIIIRMIYKDTEVTKVLKVDTGEVLLLKEYKWEVASPAPAPLGAPAPVPIRWVYYGTTDIGDWSYDNESVTMVSKKIIRAWSKLKYSKVGKNKRIQGRENPKLLSDPWNKLDHGFYLHEIDCGQNLIKRIKSIEYNTEGKIIDDLVHPNYEIDSIVPDSIMDSLRREVCK